jgi:3-(3-hydroxy-phenyl)propionate hydroxylase
LLDRARQLPNLEIRWKNKIVGLSQDGKSVDLEVETPDGNYRLSCDWLVAADGARSATRGFLGQTSSGQTFRDRFLIADVKMAADFPAERWFWFDPPFHPNQSVLLHQQPDGVWRIDFQLGWDADPVAEKRPDKVIPRVQALLGREAKFDLEWVSIYTFSCLRMEKFRHGRVLFAGDSAHGVSPFGARGANSGVQDADNLSWKLRFVLQGLSPGASDLLNAGSGEGWNSRAPTRIAPPKRATMAKSRMSAVYQRTPKRGSERTRELEPAWDVAETGWRVRVRVARRRCDSHPARPASDPRPTRRSA